MNIINRFKKLTLWNKIGIIGSIASIIGLLLFFITKDNSVEVNSRNQSGGITAGHIENVNVKLDDKNNVENLKRDANVGLIYQTEISHLILKFRVLLHWSLPLGDDANKKIDKIFKYNTDLSKAIDFNQISKDNISYIFNEYDLTKPMPNYSDLNNYKPNGFNNLLGILTYFENQLGVHLDKYGGAVSTDLSVRMEYMQRTAKSTISTIRTDLQLNNQISSSGIKVIADFFELLRDDYLLMRSNYTQNMTGGYPINVGKVTKVDEKDGGMVFESEFSNY